MTYVVYLVWLGALIQLLGSAVYIRDTLRGITKPNRVTWFFWSVAPLIGAAAAITDGVRWSALPVVMVGIMPLLILLASLFNKKSYWQLKKLDYICGIFAALALILWFITSEPLVAIVFAILADAVAGIPTLVKTCTDPETETTAEYAATVLAAITGLVAVQVWSFVETSFLIYLIILNGGVILVRYKGWIFRLGVAAR